MEAERGAGPPARRTAPVLSLARFDEVEREVARELVQHVRADEGFTPGQLYSSPSSSVPAPALTHPAARGPPPPTESSSSVAGARSVWDDLRSRVSKPSDVVGTKPAAEPRVSKPASDVIGTKPAEAAASSTSSVPTRRLGVSDGQRTSTEKVARTTLVPSPLPVTRLLQPKGESFSVDKTDPVKKSSSAQPSPRHQPTGGTKPAIAHHVQRATVEQSQQEVVDLTVGDEDDEKETQQHVPKKPKYNHPKPHAKSTTDAPSIAFTSKDSRIDQTLDRRIQSVSEALVVPILTVETQVQKAARLMAVELQHGDWPEVIPGALERAAVSLEAFAKTIFLPYMKGANATPERSFLATLLALREVLAQNADRIFVMDSVPPNGEPSDDKSAPTNRTRQDGQAQEEERSYMAQLYATGVALAAIQALDPNEAEPLTRQFTQMIDSYDTGDGEFSSCMEPMDGRHRGIMPTGKALSQEENLSWKVGFNTARAEHPVMKRNQHRLRRQQKQRMGFHVPPEPPTIEIPCPNAVLVSILETLQPL